MQTWWVQLPTSDECIEDGLILFISYNSTLPQILSSFLALLILSPKQKSSVLAGEAYLTLQHAKNNLILKSSVVDFSPLHFLNLISPLQLTCGTKLSLLTQASFFLLESFQLYDLSENGTKMEVVVTSSIRGFCSFWGEDSSWSKNSKKSSFLFIFMKTGLDRKKRLGFDCDILTFFCYNYRMILTTFTPKMPRKIAQPRVSVVQLEMSRQSNALTFPKMSSYTMYQDHHELLYQAIRKLIPPPNPIINKQIPADQPVEMIAQSLPVLRAIDIPSEDEEQPKEEECTLQSTYYRHNLVFQKCPKRNTIRDNVTYFASNFCERNNKDNLQYIGQVLDNCLEFNCNFDSGNLLSVYKTGQSQYDLILQNDLNSGGYTQWFNFTVSNFKLKGTVRFNIVNFYKKDSLFKEGMKPVTRSLVHDKNWKRSCYNVEYFISQMRMEGRKSKCYKILSFKYDFIFEGDTVQFAYCLPYSYEKLNNFLKTINSSKLRVKYLGATPMKKIVSLLQLSTESEEKKKAIVVMARQHAGQTPSSHIVQYIIEELLTSTQENEFLFSKYNFYIFPMVNVDGVFLGNYRCNFYGFDLNRCWHLQQSKKHPEITLVKNQIKRIMKRQAIELILDLHGHSAKMNSFFYGNTFGKYSMYFPLVASKLQEFIDFNSCSFTEQEYEKSNTARVVLGNMIRETGSAYTFEVSLFGGIKNGKKIAFTAEHYQGMARNLVLAMYKCDVELYKEEKFLKESLFLREVRKEIRKYEAGGRNKNENCSDEEAKKISLIEEKAKTVPQVMTATKRMESEKEKLQKVEAISKQRSVQTDFQLVLEDFKMSGIFLNDLVEKKPPQEKKKLSFSIRKVEGAGQQSSRKHELMNKLRIFGETFAQDSSILENSNRPAQTSTKETQTLLIYRWRDDSQLQTRDMSRFNPKTSSFLANSFLGRRLGQHRRRQRFTKSNSTRVTQAQVSFCDLIKHSKLSFC